MAMIDAKMNAASNMCPLLLAITFLYDLNVLFPGFMTSSTRQQHPSVSTMNKQGALTKPALILQFSVTLQQ